MEKEKLELVSSNVDWTVIMNWILIAEWIVIAIILLMLFAITGLLLHVADKRLKRSAEMPELSDDDLEAAHEHEAELFPEAHYGLTHPGWYGEAKVRSLDAEDPDLWRKQQIEDEVGRTDA